MKAVVEAELRPIGAGTWVMVPTAPPEFAAGWPDGWTTGRGYPEWIETTGPARMLGTAEHKRLTELTKMLRDRPVTSADDVQVYLPASLRELLDEWLRSRGLTLFQIPSDDPVPTFGIGRADGWAVPDGPVPVCRYEASAGVRPPNVKLGRVRGVAYEIVSGGGMELWHCDHDHAPGVRVMAKLLPSQRDAAVACAEEWLTGQVTAGNLTMMPVMRAEA